MSKYYCVSNIVFTSCHPVLIDSHANRKCRAETLTESHVKKHIPADEVGVVLPPCILVRVRHIYDVCTALTISRCMSRLQEPSQTKWAELNGLSPAVNTACLPTLLCIWSVCSQAARLRTDTQHFKLASLPTQTRWRSTHMQTVSFPSVWPAIQWFQLTAADVSQLAPRPNWTKAG